MRGIMTKDKDFLKEKRQIIKDLSKKVKQYKKGNFLYTRFLIIEIIRMHASSIKIDPIHSFDTYFVEASNIEQIYEIYIGFLFMGTTIFESDLSDEELCTLESSLEQYNYLYKKSKQKKLKKK